VATTPPIAGVAQPRSTRVAVAALAPQPLPVAQTRSAPPRSTGSGASVALINPSLPDTLTRELVDPPMLSVHPLTIECARDLDTHGVVTVHVRVDRSGAASSVTTDSEHPELARCVAATVRQLTFAATNNGGTFQRTFVL
jgi:outer membrane biosynthesis protein TonB